MHSAPQANSTAPFYRLFNQPQGVSRDAVSKCLVHLYSCNTLQTKVNAGLTQGPQIGEQSIIEEGEHHKCKDQGKPKTEPYFLHLHTEWTPSYSFNQIVHEVPTVEHRYRQKIEDSDI